METKNKKNNIALTILLFGIILVITVILAII